MTTENAIKRLLDSEQELSYSQRIAIADLIKELKEYKWMYEELCK